MGAAPRHGRVLRVRRAAHPPDGRRPSGAGGRAGPRGRRRGRQLPGPRVRRPLGDADGAGAAAVPARGGAASALPAVLGALGAGDGGARRRRACPRAGVGRRGVPRAASISPGPTRPPCTRSGCGCAPRCARATGLPASIGAGSGKQLAKIASELAKPDGLRVVAPDEERAVLDPLPVRALWGIGPVAEESLRSIDVHTVGQLAALDVREVTAALGVAIGTELHRLARGIDERPVAPRGAAKQVSAETTFDTDLTAMSAVQRCRRPDDSSRAPAPAPHRAGRAHRDRQGPRRRLRDRQPLGDLGRGQHRSRRAHRDRPAPGRSRRARGRGAVDRGVARRAHRRSAAGPVLPRTGIRARSRTAPRGPSGRGRGDRPRRARGRGAPATT